MSDTTYTDKLYQALNYSVEQFDKSVLFIASGALGITFAFVEKIVPDLKKFQISTYPQNLKIMIMYSK